MLGLLVSSELVVQLLSEAWACFSEELEEGQAQLGAFDGDTACVWFNGALVHGVSSN